MKEEKDFLIRIFACWFIAIILAFTFVFALKYKHTQHHEAIQKQNDSINSVKYLNREK